LTLTCQLDLQSQRAIIVIHTHMQNSQIKVGYVHRTRWKRTDGRDPGFLRFLLTRSAIINSDSFISVVLMLYFLLLCLVCWGGIHSGRIELNWTWPALSWPSYTARYWSDRPYWSCSQRDVVDWLQGRELPCVPKKRPSFYFLNNSVRNYPSLMIFGALNPEKIWHECLTDLSTSPVGCSHFTSGNPKKSFSALLFIYFRLFTLPWNVLVRALLVHPAH